MVKIDNIVKSKVPGYVYWDSEARRYVFQIVEVVGDKLKSTELKLTDNQQATMLRDGILNTLGVSTVLGIRVNLH